MNNKDLLSNIESIDKATSKIKDFINGLVDAESFVETDVFLTGKSFDNAVEALGEGVVTGYATIKGNSIQIFAQNADVLKGSLSAAHAEKICKCINRAIKTDTPLISIIDSCGARVGDGASIMEGYAKIIAASAELKASVPHICIVKGVSVGMMSSYVASADFVFMADTAIMSVNSPMYLVSDAKSFPIDYKEKLGYSAYKSNSDVAHFSFKNVADLNKKVTGLLELLFATNNDDEDDANRVDPNLEKLDAISAVNSICDKDSIIPYCQDYAKDVSCSIAKINGITVGVVATKGDYMSIEGIEKATDFIKKMEIYRTPIVTLVDTKGVNSTLAQEVAGFSKKTYELMATIASCTTPKIGVAFGNAIGYGYSALMSKSLGFGYTLATTRSKVAPVSEAVAIAMMSDQLKSEEKQENIEKLSKKYAEMQLNPINAAKDGYIDNVIEATNLRPYIASALMMLLGI